MRIPVGDFRMIRSRSRLPFVALAASLLLGTAVQALVAWKCYLSGISDIEVGPSPPTQQDIAWWRHNAPAGFADAPVGISEWRKLGRVNVFMYEHEPDRISNTLGNNCTRSLAGWPMLSLEGQIWVDRRTRVVTRCYAWTPPVIWTNRWLPVRPIPLGYTVNTLFYAAVWLVLLLSAQRYIRHVRAKSRLRHGLCPACAYPIGAHSVCTECGIPVKPASNPTPASSSC